MIINTCYFHLPSNIKPTSQKYDSKCSTFHIISATGILKESSFQPLIAIFSKTFHHNEEMYITQDIYLNE